MRVRDPEGGAEAKGGEGNVSMLALRELFERYLWF